MCPFLRPGSLVGVEWLASPDAKAEAGDLVLCRDGHGDWILHRLLAAEGPHWIVKGDSGFLSESFETKQIWGKVVSLKSPGGGAARPFSRGALDRLIARVSFLSLRSGKFGAPFWRRATRALSWLRRWL